MRESKLAFPQLPFAGGGIGDEGIAWGIVLFRCFATFLDGGFDSVVEAFIDLDDFVW